MKLTIIGAGPGGYSAAFAAAKEAGLKMLDDEIHGLPFWAHGVKFFTVEGPNGEKVEFCQKL